MLQRVPTARIRQDNDLRARAVIVGASSAIAEACAGRYRDRGVHVVGTYRSEPKGGFAWRQDGDAAVHWTAADPASDDEVIGLIEGVGVDEVVIVAGSMAGDFDAVATATFLGPARLAERAAKALVEDRVACGGRWGRPRIVLVGSVAGDRGRAVNGAYGAAKAGLAAFASALAQKHHGELDVLLVKPGFVRTRMTDGMPLPPLLTAEPDEVAAVIVDGPRSGVRYVRKLWRPMMAAIRMIPRPVFNRMSF